MPLFIIHIKFITFVRAVRWTGGYLCDIFCKRTVFYVIKKWREVKEKLRTALGSL